jgi:hypothetical protein
LSEPAFSLSKTEKVAKLTSEISSSPRKTWWLTPVIGVSVDVSIGASADAPLASANKPAAPNTGMTLALRFRIETRFARDIGEDLLIA